MDDGRTLTITLDEQTAMALEAAVKASEHPSMEAAAAAAIDEWWADRVQDAIGIERVRQMIQDGIDSGPGKPADEVFDRLIAKYEAMAQAKGE